MFKILSQIVKIGNLTETAPVIHDAELEKAGIELRRLLDSQMQGSFAIRQVDAGSCNGCELEIHALNNAYYDISRFGVHFVPSPRQADALLVTGPVSRHMETALRRTWRATPAPKMVIAAGDCACNGGIFGETYATCGAVENVIPVDAKIPGCPPEPLVLLKAILAILDGHLTENSRLSGDRV